MTSTAAATANSVAVRFLLMSQILEQELGHEGTQTKIVG
jgi:hypothetical protein